MKTKEQFKRKKSGFTLVELLAVIVILAIIMIIAIPAVLDTMQNARKQTFKEYAMKVATKGQEIFLSDQLITNPGSCVLYSIKDDLGLDNIGDYNGYVVVNNVNDDTKIYVTLNDNEYMVYAVELNQLDSAELISYNKTSSYLSENNILSIAGCESYSTKSSSSTYESHSNIIDSNSQSSTPEEKPLLTGEKEGANYWVGVYEEGELVGCYNSLGDIDGSNGGANYLNNGTLEKNYCTGTVSSTNATTCANAKSTICCSAAADDMSYHDIRVDQYAKRNYCGAVYIYVSKNWFMFWEGGVGGGALPTSGVRE